MLQTAELEQGPPSCEDEVLDIDIYVDQKMVRE